MRYFKVVGLCLVAAFAMSAVAAATALASEGPTILFPNGGGGKPNFSSIAGKGKLVTTVAGKSATVECTSGRNTGEAVAGTDRVKNVSITFLGCTLEIKGEAAVKCNSTGQAAGIIKTFLLEGQLGYLHLGSPLTVGLVLKAEVNATTNPNTLFAEFKCSLDTVRVRGREIKEKEFAGVIGEILPESLNVLIDEKKPGFLTYLQEPAGEPVQKLRALTVLGTLIEKLLLSTLVTGGTAFELSGLEQEKNTELFFLESVLISA
jgi:hypothetical protein